MGRMQDAMLRALTRRKERLLDEGDSHVRPLVTTTTTTNPMGEEETTLALGDPIPAWISFQNGTERVQSGRLEQDQAGVVQVAYGDAQTASLDAADRLAYQGEVLHVHSLTNMSQQDVLVELTVTRTGEDAPEEVAA